MGLAIMGVDIICSCQTKKVGKWCGRAAKACGNYCQFGLLDLVASSHVGSSLNEILNLLI